MSSRVRTGRSVRGLCLPPAMCRAERREVEHVLSDVLGVFDGPLAGTYYSLKSLQPDTTQRLIDVCTLSLKAPKYFRINHGDQRVSQFEIIINVLVSSS